MAAIDIVELSSASLCLSKPVSSNSCETLQHSSGVARSVSWLLLEKVTRLLLSGASGFLVARYLGVHHFGVLNYVLAIGWFGQVFAEFGVDAVAKREIARGKSARSVLLTAFALRGCAGLIAFLATLAFSLLQDGTEARVLMMIAAAMAFQPAAAVGELWMGASMQWPTVARVQLLTAACAFGVRCVLVWLHGSVVAFVVVAVAEIVAAGVIVSICAWNKGAANVRESGTWSVASFIKESLPLLGSGIAVALYMRVDVLMLEALAGKREVGLYTAAVRIAEMFNFFPVAVASVLLPVLTRMREQDEDRYERFALQYLGLSVFTGYIICLSTVAGSGLIIDVVFGEGFAGAKPVLIFISLSIVSVFAGVAMGQLLVVTQQSRVYLACTVVGCVLNVAINLLLIPRYGAKGAAIATVASYTAVTALPALLCPDMRRMSRRILYRFAWPFACLRKQRLQEFWSDCGKFKSPSPGGAPLK